MAGHRPFRELTKNHSPEHKRRIKETVAEMEAAMVVLMKLKNAFPDLYVENESNLSFGFGKCGYRARRCIFVKTTRQRTRRASTPVVSRTSPTGTGCGLLGQAQGAGEPVDITPGLHHRAGARGCGDSYTKRRACPRNHRVKGVKLRQTRLLRTSHRRSQVETIHRTYSDSRNSCSAGGCSRAVTLALRWPRTTETPMRRRHQVLVYGLQGRQALTLSLTWYC